MFTLILSQTLLLVPVRAEEFSNMTPIPWEARCVVVGKSATPRLVCEIPLKPKEPEKEEAPTTEEAE